MKIVLENAVRQGLALKQTDRMPKIIIARLSYDVLNVSLERLTPDYGDAGEVIQAVARERWNVGVTPLKTVERYLGKTTPRYFEVASAFQCISSQTDDLVAKILAGQDVSGKVMTVRLAIIANKNYLRQVRGGYSNG